MQKYYTSVKHTMYSKILCLCETPNECKNIIPMWNTQCMQKYYTYVKHPMYAKYNTYVKHPMYAKI